MDRFLPSRENVKKFLQDVTKDKLGENEYTDMFFSDELQDEMSEALVDSITPNWLPNPNQNSFNVNISYLSLTIAPNNSPKDSNDSSSTTSPITFKITKAHIKESSKNLFMLKYPNNIQSNIESRNIA
ncbi:hypothetical protein VP612_001765 [Campylobacter coli]|nr:hypothetical protein [Campylobacter coli]